MSHQNVNISHHFFPLLQSIQKLDDINNMPLPLSPQVHLFRDFGTTTNASSDEDFSDFRSLSDFCFYESHDFLAKIDEMLSPDALPFSDIDFSLFSDDPRRNSDEQPLTDFLEFLHMSIVLAQIIQIQSQKNEKEPQHVEAEELKSQSPITTADGLCSKKKAFHHYKR